MIDIDRAELRHAETPVRLEPQVFDLLVLLVSSCGRVVSRDEMFQAIWGDRIVSDAALSTRIKEAHKAIGDSGTTQKYIRTVQRRGLMFVGDVDVRDKPAQQSAPHSTAAQVQSLGRAVVAVMPIETLRTYAEDQDLAEALTDELTTCLAYWRTCLVVPRQAVARLPNTLTTIAEISAALKTD